MATQWPTLTVKLPDGTPISSWPKGATGADAAAAIGPGLARAALAVKADGELRDLSAPLADGGEIEVVTDEQPGGAGADPPRRRPRARRRP